MLTTLTRVASLPNPLFAVHLYNPTSVLFTLKICSLWPVRLNWSWATPIFVHVILGKGSPEALHVKVTFFPASISTTHGGFSVIFGGTERYRKSHSMPWTGFQNNHLMNTHSHVTKYMYGHSTSTMRGGQRSLWYYIGDRYVNMLIKDSVLCSSPWEKFIESLAFVPEPRVLSVIKLIND